MYLGGRNGGIKQGGLLGILLLGGSTGSSGGVRSASGTREFGRLQGSGFSGFGGFWGVLGLGL